MLISCVTEMWKQLISEGKGNPLEFSWSRLPMAALEGRLIQLRRRDFQGSMKRNALTLQVQLGAAALDAGRS